VKVDGLFSVNKVGHVDPADRLEVHGGTTDDHPKGGQNSLLDIH
jgi:hypothetical protein